MAGGTRTGSAVRQYMLSDGVHFEWVHEDVYSFEMRATFPGLDDADPEKLVSCLDETSGVQSSVVQVI